jgi:hypothetical protein
MRDWLASWHVLALVRMSPFDGCGCPDEPSSIATLARGSADERRYPLADFATVSFIVFEEQEGVS